MTETPPSPRNNNGGYIKPITETVKALSGTPMLLVLLVLNVLILGMITYLLRVRAEAIREERQEVMKMLSECYEGQKRNNYYGPSGQPRHTE